MTIFPPYPPHKITDLERSKRHYYHQITIWYDEQGQYATGYYKTWYWYVEVCQSIGSGKSRVVREYFPTIASAKRFIDSFSD